MTDAADFAPGYIVEIRTPAGLAYVQVTHRHPSYPEVVRALPGLHAERPDLAALAAGPSSFTAMIPLRSALARLGLDGERCARAEVPETERAFPTFRIPIRDKEGGIAYWWFWDGESLSYDTDLGPEREHLPIREVMSSERFLARLTGA